MRLIGDRKTINIMGEETRPKHYSIVNNKVVFTDATDIGEHERESILSRMSPSEGKIKDPYQLPYAIKAVSQMLEYAKPTFPIDAILMSDGVENCPPFLKCCINHCIKKVIDTDLFCTRGFGNELGSLCKLRAKYMTGDPRTIACAYSELNRRVQKTDKTYEWVINAASKCWYMRNVKYIDLFVAFEPYDRKNISNAFIYGRIPDDQSFYDIKFYFLIDMLWRLEDEGIIKRANSDSAMVAESDNEDKAMYSKSKPYRNNNVGKKWVKWIPISSVWCGLCKKQGHVASRCPLRKKHPEFDQRKFYSTKFIEILDVGNEIPKNYRAVVESPNIDISEKERIKTVFDSGTTVSCFAEDKKIQNQSICNQPIQTANGITIASRKGTYDDGTLKLKEVYILPNLGANLISMNQMCEEGYQFIVNNKEMQAIKGKQVIFRVPNIQGVLEYITKNDY